MSGSKTSISRGNSPTKEFGEKGKNHKDCEELQDLQAQTSHRGRCHIKRNAQGRLSWVVSRTILSVRQFSLCKGSRRALTLLCHVQSPSRARDDRRDLSPDTPRDHDSNDAPIVPRPNTIPSVRDARNRPPRHTQGAWQSIVPAPIPSCPHVRSMPNGL